MFENMKFDLVVIGGGSGGIATANRAASYGARVLLIENKLLGGTCVNVGCVPKKVMWNAANMQDIFRVAGDYGFSGLEIKHDFSKLVAARQAYIQRLNGIYEKTLTGNKVEICRGKARLLSKNQVAVNEYVFEADHILLATGGKPKRPPIPGAYYGVDSDGFFELKELPKRTAVVGTGYIGVEFAGVLSSLGSKVTLFGKDSRVIKYFDHTIAEALTKDMASIGVEVINEKHLSEVRKDESGFHIETSEGDLYEGFDCLIWAIGREANPPEGCKEIGLKFDEWGFLDVDQWQQTNLEGIYCLGDLTGRFPLTPVAIAAGRRLADRVFGGKKDIKLDYENIPSVIFSHPPVASVGLSEQEALEAYGAGNIKTYESRFVNMFYALSEEKHQSVMKLVCQLPDEKVLGVHAFGMGADEMIQGFAVALRMGAKKSDFDRTVAVHPTASEELVLMR